MWDNYKCLDTASDPTGAGIATISCIGPVIQNVINAALVFVGIVSLILIIISSIKFIFSGGDPKQVEGARNTLTYAIIGFLVVVLSFTILNLIAYVTGVNCITLFGTINCQ